MSTERNHAEQNGQGHAESILELWRAWTALENDGAEQAEADGCEFTDAYDVRDHATESALDVNVRSGWHTPGSEAEPEEFAILMSTGGPALRIVGDLDRGTPEHPALEIQDWGTPWTEYRPSFENEQDDEDFDEALAWFVACFYFGD